MKFEFTWKRVKCSGHAPKEEVAKAADGTKIGFCRHCNYICYWR